MKIGAQLFTVHDITKTLEDFSETLKKVADIGYTSVQVGTRTVNVPEESHYETKIVKEAWTEKKLIREAGWY